MRGVELNYFLITNLFLHYFVRNALKCYNIPHPLPLGWNTALCIMKVEQVISYNNVLNNLFLCVYFYPLPSSFYYNLKDEKHGGEVAISLKMSNRVIWSMIAYYIIYQFAIFIFNNNYNISSFTFSSVPVCVKNNIEV